MKKGWTIVTIFCLISLSGCVNSTKNHTFPVGQITIKDLFAQQKNFDQNYINFTLTSKDIQLINQWPNEITMDVFFGTWCHDSQREVPKLLKMLSYNKNISVNLIALDYQKSDPLGLAKDKEIKFTPTIIIYQKNKEIGRIIERPKHSLIIDIEAFVNNSK